MRVKKSLLIFVLLPFFVCAQQSESLRFKVDSLKHVINTAQHDSIVVNAWMEWDNLIYRSDPDLDLALNLKIDSVSQLQLSKNLKPAEERFFLKSGGFSSGNIGFIYNARGQQDKALSYHEKSLEYKMLVGDQKPIANSLMNIGSIYHEQGIHDKAVAYYTRSLAVYEKINDYRGQSAGLNNIGLLLSSQGDYIGAIDYYRKSLAIKQKIEDSLGMGSLYVNIGSLHNDLKQYQQAIAYYDTSITIYEKLGDKGGIALNYVSLGTVYSSIGDYQKALDYFSKGLTIQKELDDPKRVASTYKNMGVLYKNMGDMSEAKRYGTKALEIAREVEMTKISKEAAELLWQVNKSTESYADALEMYELYIELRDSINSYENQKELFRQKFKYEYEKRAAADSVKSVEAAKIKDAQLETERANNRRQRLIIYFVVALVVVTLFFVFMVLKSLRLVKIEKTKVDIAYGQLEEKNTEILDSITYAKRIQSAILPRAKVVKEYLPESFIVYKPKDIVAGDFYWLEHIGETILFAVCDCTGHGVPGAMVSVVCNNGLNRSVREYGLSEPGKILDKTREVIVAEFEKSEEEVKDGMDIALCKLSGRTLEYAGAHNPLWIIRNGANEVEEIKANKQPIGKYDTPLPYQTHALELSAGDTIYIFSDGYADQFGGTNGKKFKASNFKKLLVSIQNEPMDKQRELIDDAFENWKGKLEQLDDVCVIGVRV